MTVRMYPNFSTGAVAVTQRGTWDGLIAIVLAMSRAKSGTSTQVDGSMPSGAGALRKELLRYFVSEPIVTAGTLGGTLAWCAQGATGGGGGVANARIAVHVWVTVGNTNAVRGTLLSTTVGTATAFPNNYTPTGRAETAKALSPVACQVGDRIVVEFGLAHTSTAGRDYSLRWGGTGATDLANGNTQTNRPAWFDFSDADTLFSSTPSPASATIAATLPKLTSAAAAKAAAVATINRALPALTGTATGAARSAGASAAVLPALAGQLTATVTDITATAAIAATLPALASQAAAKAPAKATTAADLPALTGIAEADAPAIATTTTTLPALTGLATGTAPVRATIPATLPALGGQATASAPALVGSAVITTTLPTLTGHVAGAAPATARTAAALPALVAALTAAAPARAALAAALPAVVGQVDALAATTATTTPRLPALTAAPRGATTAAGAITARIPALRGTVRVAAPAVGQAAVTLPALTCMASGRALVRSNATIVLPSLTAEVLGHLHRARREITVHLGDPFTTHLLVGPPDPQARITAALAPRPLATGAPRTASITAAPPAARPIPVAPARS